MREFLFMLIGAAVGAFTAIVIKLFMPVMTRAQAILGLSVCVLLGAVVGYIIPAAAPTNQSPGGQSAAPASPPSTTTTTPVPPTTTQPSPSPTPQPPPAPETYLDEISDSQVIRGPGGFQTGSYTVNGTTYARAVAFPTPCGQYPEVVDFVLSRRFGTFDAIIGVSDDSGSDAKAQFEVAADGSRVGGPYVLTVGQQQEIHVNIGKPVKLRLTATNVGGCSNYFTENGIAVWGDAKLSE